MEEKLMNIITHYGVLSQLEYLQTEVMELAEAIVECELAKEAIDENGNLIFGLKAFKENIKGELADNLVMLNQIKVFYDCNVELFDIELADKKYSFTMLKSFARDIHRLSISVVETEMFKQTNGFYNILDIADICNNLEKVFYALKSFALLYDINQEDLQKVMEFKINRQLERIENEN